MVLHPNGEIDKVIIPFEFHDLFNEKMEKQEKLNKEINKLKYEIMKSKYKDNNTLIRLYFKEVELSNIKNELFFMLTIFSQENLKKDLLDEILTELDNDNFSDLL